MYRPTRITTRTLLILTSITATILALPTTAAAETFKWPFPVSGPHEYTTDNAIIANEQEYWQSGTLYKFRKVYLPTGQQLDQEWRDPSDGSGANEGAGWYTLIADTLNAVQPWGTTYYGQRLAPRTEPDRCATMRLPRFGWSKVIELRGRCRGIKRRATGLARRLRGTGNQRVGQWRCVVSAGGAHCRTGRHYRNSRHVTIRRTSRKDVREQRTVRRQSLTRCGRAVKTTGIIVWTRRVDCRRMLAFGMNVAEAYGIGNARPHPDGWHCGGYAGAWACRRDGTRGSRGPLVIFQPWARSWPKSMRVIRGPWGGAYVLGVEPR